MLRVVQVVFHVHRAVLGRHHNFGLSFPGTPDQRLGLVGVGRAQGVKRQRNVVLEQLGLALFYGLEHLGAAAQVPGRVHLDVELHDPGQRAVDVHLAADEVAHRETRVEALLPVDARESWLPVVAFIRHVPRDLKREQTMPQ